MDGGLRGQFYFDLYARQNKRGGAWMADCQSRFKTAAMEQIPVAYMVCNFTPPIGERPRCSRTRGRDAVSRVRARAAPHADAGRPPGHRRYQRGGLGRGRAAVTVHGELLLGARGTGPVCGAPRDRRAHSRRPVRPDDRGEELPVRHDDGAPAGVRAVRFPDPQGIRPRAGRAHLRRRSIACAPRWP
jgi:hypothetical protein